MGRVDPKEELVWKGKKLRAPFCRVKLKIPPRTSSEEMKQAVDTAAWSLGERSKLWIYP